jgi:hypothetical protein
MAASASQPLCQAEVMATASSACWWCALPTPASSGAAWSMCARHSSALPAASALAQAAIAIIHASPDACAILSASSAVSFASSVGR